MGNILIAAYAKRNFGTCLAEAPKGPVIIQKYGRPSMMMASYEAFQRLNASEDALWLQRAQEAADGGYLTPENSDEARPQTYRDLE